MNTRAQMLIAVGAFAGVAAAGEPEVIRLWTGDAPGTVAGASRETIEPEGRFGRVNVPTLTAYLPEKEARNGCAVIVCPGGAYAVCDFNHHGTRLAERLNPEGIAVFVLKYRLRPPSTNVVAEALADAERAVRLVRSRAADFGLDPARIGMAGYSAGANLTVHIASAFDAGNPDAGDPVERVSSRPDFIALLCPWAGPGGTRCPYPLRPDSPPAFIRHAKDDAVAPVSVAEDIVATLEKFHIPVDLHVYERGGHGNFTPGGATLGGSWPEQFVAWLRGRALVPMKPTTQEKTP